MWIIPSNLPLSSAFAQDYLASKEGLSELESARVSWPMWKSKPSSLATWLLAWKRVYWMRPLFGRMLKPSRHRDFEIKYTGSLADIHVSLSALSEPRPDLRTLLISGHPSEEPKEQLDLFSSSSKMSSTIS